VLIFALVVHHALIEQELHTLRLNQRAVGVLTASDTLAIRGRGRSNSGRCTVCIGSNRTTWRSSSVSHVVAPPAGQHYVAEAWLDDRWQSLGTFDTNTALIAEGPQWATPPEAIRVRLEPSEQLVLDWHG
jgi:hypothetical protein